MWLGWLLLLLLWRAVLAGAVGLLRPAAAKADSICTAQAACWWTVARNGMPAASVARFEPNCSQHQAAYLDFVDIVDGLVELNRLLCLRGGLLHAPTPKATCETKYSLFQHSCCCCST
jgi:hypothetical protein